MGTGLKVAQPGAQRRRQTMQTKKIVDLSLFIRQIPYNNRAEQLRQRLFVSGADNYP
jgi:regulator of sirC expression with transglutaminase-like and TPR domain